MIDGHSHRRGGARVLIYSHDTFGLGHLRRCRAIAHALVGDDWPPAWARDPEDPAQVAVDPTLWPKTRAGEEMGDRA